MKKSILVMALLTSASIWMSCNDQTPAPATMEPAPSFDLAGARKVVDSMNMTFGALAAKGDSAGIAALYTSDAKVMAPNGPAVQGTTGITADFGAMLRSGIGKAELKTVDLWGNEELLSEEGTYALSTKDGKEIDKGKYIVLWKKEGGNWKLFRDIFNSDMPPAPAK